MKLLNSKKHVQIIHSNTLENTSPAVGEIIEMIENRPDSLQYVRKDSVIRQQIETRQKILGLA